MIVNRCLEETGHTRPVFSRKVRNIKAKRREFIRQVNRQTELSKKHFPEGGYLEGMLESKDDAKVSVNVEGEIKVFKEDQVDMADLTFLGDACFLSKMSSYTATVGSCASQSIPTSGSQFTPFKQWNSMLVRGAVNARPISLPLLKEHTKECKILVAISPSLRIPHHRGI